VGDGVSFDGERGGFFDGERGAFFDGERGAFFGGERGAFFDGDGDGLPSAALSAASFDGERDDFFGGERDDFLSDVDAADFILALSNRIPALPMLLRVWCAVAGG
jgi:hypothetical protein